MLKIFAQLKAFKQCVRQKNRDFTSYLRVVTVSWNGGSRNFELFFSSFQLKFNDFIKKINERSICT